LSAGIAMTMAPVTGFVATMVGLMIVCILAVIFLERRDRGTARGSDRPT
jgi:hypothetical protein